MATKNSTIARGLEHARFKAEVLRELDGHPFRAPWWLRNSHVQTSWAPFFRKTSLPPLRLERLDTPDDDFLRVHFLDGDPDLPAVLLLHGLEGSVESTYIVGLHELLKPLGWTVVSMEHRSCGGEMNRARRMYHSGETSDLAFLVDTLVSRWPARPVYIAGVSLGGNVLAKWLGETGEAVPDNVRAAAVISAPYDLTASGPQMDRIIRRPYVRHFLHTLVPKAVLKERQYPGCLDVERVKRSRTFEDFDTHATAALHGFADATDYYRKVGCGQFLHGIRRPTMLLSAADDPFNPGATLPIKTARDSEFLIPQFTRRGGHVGFVYGDSPRDARYWAEEQIVRFFRTCHKRTE